MTTHSAPVDHFTTLVQWSEFGPPLRPSPADIATLQRVIHDTAPKCALLLGLTPEIAGCEWPSGAEFIAVDHSQEMIRRLWPPPAAPEGARVIPADWCNIPIPSGSVDLVAGDGCLTLLTFDGWRRLAREVRRVLTPTGRFVLRLFLCPDVPEPISSIGRDLKLGRIRSINALKLRLFAAVHDGGALLDDVWQAWSTMRCEPREGFSAEAIAGVERYRGADSRYFLGTAADVRTVLGTEFVELAWLTPSGYELAERCPTVVFGV